MWTCNKCSEQPEDSWDVCWNCGTSSEGVENPTFKVAEDRTPLDAEKEDQISKQIDEAKFECPTCNESMSRGYVWVSTLERVLSLNTRVLIGLKAMHLLTNGFSLEDMLTRSNLLVEDYLEVNQSSKHFVARLVELLRFLRDPSVASDVYVTQAS